MIGESAGKNGYLPRYLDEELNELLGPGMALSIEGARSIGKTETASRRSDLILHLDDEATLQLVAADASLQLTSAPRVCVDEWQIHPPVWDVVRRLIDERTRQEFLLTGSAKLPPGVTKHTGAGRIMTLRMRPLALSERVQARPTVQIADLFRGIKDIAGETPFGLVDYAEQICASGFPRINQLSPRRQRAALQGYVENLLDRELPENDLMVRSPQSMLGWLRAYAAASSTTASYDSVLRAATAGDVDKPSKATTQRYRDALSSLWILDPIPAWSPSGAPFSRLTVAPKHQLCDPGLAAHVLNLTPESLVSPNSGASEFFGQLFESLAALTVRSAGQAAEAATFHFRTRGGEQDVDLILERFDGKVLAFEVKLAAVVSDSDVRHLHFLGERLGDRLVDKVVITTGKQAFRRADGVAVVPLALLG